MLFYMPKLMASIALLIYDAGLIHNNTVHKPALGMILIRYYYFVPQDFERSWVGGDQIN